MSPEERKPAVSPPSDVTLSGRGWHERLRTELLQVPGLFALLMKPRNGVPWSADERVLLRTRLYGLSHLSTVLALLALPGSTVLLPLLAWWFDRRRRPRMPQK